MHYTKKKIWLIEDNTSGQSKTKDVILKYQLKYKIFKTLYLPNLLDLNMIKTL